MTRVKNKKKHNNYVNFIGRKNNCKKLVKQYYIRSLQKKYIDKKKKKRFLTIKKNILINLITRIYFGFSYSKFINLLNINNCKINKLSILNILTSLIF